MTPVYINDRRLIPVYSLGDGLHVALYELTLVEDEVAEGATSWLEST